MSRNLAARDIAVDVMRGFLIMAMILVNHPLPGAPVYGPLAHAGWMGWTFADTIFPAFLFLVGISIHFALPGPGRNSTREVRAWPRILRRWGLLLGTSILLVNFPYYSLSTLDLSGTLAHIAWCYLFAAVARVYLTWRSQFVLLLLLLAGQSVALLVLQVPGFGAGVITTEGNGAGYVDRLVFGSLAAHLGQPVSQGLLVTMGGVATTLLGVLTGRWLQTGTERAGLRSRLITAGLVSLILGGAWQIVLPVSKPLWTSSYVALTAGVSLLVLAAIHRMIELRGSSVWAHPFQVVGVNALFVYVFAQCLQRVLVYGRVPTEDGSQVRLRVLLYQEIFAPWAPGEAGSLLFVVIYLLICYAVAAWLFHHRIFIKF